MRLASHQASSGTSSVPTNKAIVSAPNGLVCMRLMAKPTPTERPPVGTASQSHALPSAACSG